MKMSREEALATIVQSPAEYVIGVDEVAFGSLAGPLVVAGVICQKGWADARVKDSKVLRPAARRNLISNVLVFPAIREYHVQMAQPEEIDHVGIRRLLNQLTTRVIEVLVTGHLYDLDVLVVLDGTGVQISKSLSTKSCKSVTILQVPKADQFIPSVSAASVIAKEKQLSIMEKLHDEYPVYGFNNNAGYGTPNHLLALKKFGPCPAHRRSFGPVRKFSDQQPVG